MTLRYFNVYGDRQPIKGTYAPVVGLFHRQREAGKHLTIVGNGNQTRDFTNIDDVVNANMLALTGIYKDKNYGEIYNIGTGQNYSINDVAKMISPNGSYMYIAHRPGEAKDTRADITKAIELLKYKPTHRVNEGIKETVTWYMKDSK